MMKPKAIVRAITNGTTRRVRACVLQLRPVPTARRINVIQRQDVMNVARGRAIVHVQPIHGHGVVRTVIYVLGIQLL